jgi:hypothetical protein
MLLEVSNKFILALFYKICLTTDPFVQQENCRCNCLLTELMVYISLFV